MKFMILGAGPGLPSLENDQSSLLVLANGLNILIDCGEGVSKKLLKLGFNGNFLDAVIISHYHPDHISGLFMLMQMFYLEKRSKPLHLFLPERPSALMEVMHLFYTFENRFPFRLQVHEVKDVELVLRGVSSFLTDHLRSYEDYLQTHHEINQMYSFATLFTENAKNLLYTSDITTFANLESAMDVADIVIVDALHPEADIITALQDKQVSRVILTHGISDELNNWLELHPHSKFACAQEDVFYEL